MFLTGKNIFTLVLIPGFGVLLFFFTIRKIVDEQFSSQTDENTNSFSNKIFIWLVIIFALLIATYFTTRQNFRWMEIDTGRITDNILRMKEENSIMLSSKAYPHGYAYQAMVLLLSQVTNISILDIQIKFMPFFGVCLVVFSALGFYFTLSRSWPISIISTLFLFIQPDFLYAILRGSHEKLDWPLMLFAIMLLLESINLSDQKKLVYILGFYILVFAKIATNVFFASNFIFAFLISLLLGIFLWSLGKIREMDGRNIGRQVFIVLTSSVLLFVFMAYVYLPSWGILQLLPTILDKVVMFLFTFDFVANPYGYINYGWIDPSVYWILSSFTWIMIILSFVEWIRRGIILLRGRNECEFWKNLDWFLYAGFAIQIFLSIIIDVAGVLAANMQLRILPGFTIFASIILARRIYELVLQLSEKNFLRVSFTTLISILFGVFTITGLLKSSIEPMLSNKWIVYTEGEEVSLDWIEESFSNKKVWTGIDERIFTIYLASRMYKSISGNQFDYWGLDTPFGVDYILLSENDKYLINRQSFDFPHFEYPRIYDNGDVSVIKITDE